MNEILPCPHCKKTADDQDPETLKNAVVATTYYPSVSAVVQCNFCGLSGPIYGDIDQAIKAWNNLPRNTHPKHLKDEER